MELQDKHQSSIQVVQSYFASLARGDLEALDTLFAEDVIWHQPGKGLLSGIYKGKQAVFALFGKFMQISEGTFKINSVDSIMENGNFISATLRFSAKKKSGAEIDMNGVDLMKVENGKLKEVYLFSADQEAEDQFWI